MTEHGRLTLLNDSYNANPASFRALVDLVGSMRAGRRLVFVAGTMRELGADSAAEHVAIADVLAALNPDVLGAVGEFVPALQRHRALFGPRLLTADDAVALAPLMAAELRGDELVVLKGSRGERLERMIPELAGRAAT